MNTKCDFIIIDSPPSKYTFDDLKIRAWVGKWCKGKVLNLFAGKNIVDPNETRVDTDPNMPNIHHQQEAEEFVRESIQLGRKWDTVILDPPFSERKAREKYDGRYIGNFTKLKNEITDIINPGGRVITFGYQGRSMYDKRGYKRLAILMIDHMGDFNSTIGVVEERKPSLEEF